MCQVAALGGKRGRRPSVACLQKKKTHPCFLYRILMWYSSVRMQLICTEFTVPKLTSFLRYPAVRPGDALASGQAAIGMLMFQSAPGREAGRCSISPASTAGNAPFQSAPGREAGRCPAQRCADRCRDCFNPRPAVRPGDASSCWYQRAAFARFNPRPAVRPGDAVAAWVNFSATLVSIRARP